MMRSTLPTLLAAAMTLAVSPALTHAANSAFIEAESFDTYGGWVLDTQFIEIMGSPYLMAHGLGTPVKDATTTTPKAVPAGKYRVWVRTKNWVGPWDAKGAPGKFQLSLNGKVLEKDFGTTGKDWQWDDGGTVDLAGGRLKVSLQDKTGFNGRVDAIFLTSDLEAKPPVEAKALASFRHKELGLPDTAPESRNTTLSWWAAATPAPLPP
jgi:hypothetical protein